MSITSLLMCIEISKTINSNMTPIIGNQMYPQLKEKPKIFLTSILFSFFPFFNYLDFNTNFRL